MSIDNMNKKMNTHIKDMFAIKTGSFPKGPKIKVGDVVILDTWNGFEANIKSINTLPGQRVQIILDWGKLGTSRVYLHEYGKEWKLKSEVN